MWSFGNVDKTVRNPDYDGTIGYQKVGGIMACSVEEILSSLMLIEKENKDLSTMLQNENEKIAQTMNMVQSTFGDQRIGQTIVQLMNNSMHKGITIGSTLVSIESKLQKYSLNLQK